MSSGRFSVAFIGNSDAGGHTVYTIKITSPDAEHWTIRKRYREIRDLHDELKKRHGDALPGIPGKRLFGSQDPDFVAQRQAGLQECLQAILALERDAPSRALTDFLGKQLQPQGERSQSRQYQQILDDMQKKLLNLALPPAPLDDHEMSLRLKKYGAAMKLTVLAQPVDPFHLRAPGFDADPVQLCSTNSERFNALCAPPRGGADRQMLDTLIGELQEVLRPTTPIADPDKLITPFPPVVLPSASS